MREGHGADFIASGRPGRRRVRRAPAIPSAIEWIPILSDVSQSSRLRRRALVAVPLVMTALFLLASPAMAAAGSGLNPLLPNAVSPNGQALYQLYNLISFPALVVFR